MREGRGGDAPRRLIWACWATSATSAASAGWARAQRVVGVENEHGAKPEPVAQPVAPRSGPNLVQIAHQRYHARKEDRTMYLQHWLRAFARG